MTVRILEADPEHPACDVRVRLVLDLASVRRKPSIGSLALLQ